MHEASLHSETMETTMITPSATDDWDNNDDWSWLELGKYEYADNDGNPHSMPRHWNPNPVEEC